MASSVVRRPLPALIALLALLLLTALVWWRVLHRDTGDDAHASTCPTPTPTVTVTQPAVTLPKLASVNLQVLNATDRTGIAGDARTAFIAAGFNSSRQAANYVTKHKVTGVGEIRYTPKTKAAATVIGYYLPGARLVAVSAKRNIVIVVLGPKYKRIATKATVDAALAAHDATISGAPAAPAPHRHSC